MPLWVMIAGCSGPDARPPGYIIEPPQVTVLSVEPADGTGGVPMDAPVVVTFSGNPGGVTSARLEGISTHNTKSGNTITLVPNGPHIGSLIDVTVTALDGTFTSTYQTALLDRVDVTPPSTEPPAAWHFTEVAEEAGLIVSSRWTGQGGLRPTVSGFTVGDYDDDGFVDVYTGRTDQDTTHLFRNLGDGTFDDVGNAAGVTIDDASIVGPIFVDLDADGDLDLMAPVWKEGASHTFENQGNGTFTEITVGLEYPLGVPTFGTTWGDYDGDLDLDVFAARFSVDDPTDPHFLYRNNGGTFSDVSAAAGLYFLDIQQSFTPNFADMDDDGFPELLVAADHHHSVYLRNNADGTFLPDLAVDLTDENGMGASVADYDNDGDLDWFVTAIYDPNGVSENIWGVHGNRLYNNQGDGHLVDVSEAAGVRDGSWGWGTCFADLDLDGHLDLFQVNGWYDIRDIAKEEYGKDRARLFHANGDGTFTERALELGITDTSMGRGVACFDYDRDGDIDLLTTPYEGRALLHRNDGARQGHFLNVTLDGKAPNTQGVGARVTITTGGTTQMRELRLGSNYGSNDPVEAHFGVGDATVIEALHVRWPDGTESRALSVPADRFVVVSQPSATGLEVSHTGEASPLVDPDPDPEPDPELPIDPEGPYIAIAASERNGCALTEDGVVTCWGEAYYDLVDAAPTGAGHHDLTLGWDIGCVIDATQTPRCWGDDLHGVVTTAPTLPTDRVSVGTWHACALNGAGLSSCWGSTVAGKDIAPSGTPLRQISAGHQHTCGIRTVDQSLTCWGAPGPWTDGPTNDTTGPWRLVGSGRDVSCALHDTDEHIQCWGPSGDPVASAPGGTGYTALSVGRDGHACAIDSGGGIVCWGANTFGESDVPLLAGGSWVDVAAGGDHTCALTNAGAVACWGDDTFHQTAVP